MVLTIWYWYVCTDNLKLPFSYYQIQHWHLYTVCLILMYWHWKLPVLTIWYWYIYIDNLAMTFRYWLFGINNFTPTHFDIDNFACAQFDLNNLTWGTLVLTNWYETTEMDIFGLTNLVWIVRLHNFDFNILILTIDYYNPIRTVVSW